MALRMPLFFQANQLRAKVMMTYRYVQSSFYLFILLRFFIFATVNGNPRVPFYYSTVYLATNGLRRADLVSQGKG